jgi:hypothetical protein
MFLQAVGDQGTENKCAHLDLLLEEEGGTEEGCLEESAQPSSECSLWLLPQLDDINNYKYVVSKGANKNSSFII